MQPTLRQAASLALVLALHTCNAFLAPSPGATIAHCLVVTRQVCTTTMSTPGADGGEALSSWSRGTFLARGASSAASAVAAWTLVGSASVGAPGQAIAKDIVGIDVRGIDVSEILHPGAGEGGGKASKPLRDCVLNVERVRVSTKQLEDDLTNKGAPPGLNGLVKGLIKNYKLDESLRQGAMYIESSGDRRTADSAGREALEYLAQTAEYFPVELDERTGMVKVLNAEALEFTVNALGATRAKLDLYLSKLPPDALREARAELKAEGGGVE